MSIAFRPCQESTMPLICPLPVRSEFAPGAPIGCITINKESDQQGLSRTQNPKATMRLNLVPIYCTSLQSRETLVETVTLSTEFILNPSLTQYRSNVFSCHPQGALEISQLALHDLDSMHQCRAAREKDPRPFVSHALILVESQNNTSNRLVSHCEV